MNNLILGCKYYRYDENNNIEVVRVYKLLNNEYVKIYLDDDKDTKIKISIKELEEKYVKLNPHAIINFCIAKIGNNLDDIIVTMHKMLDLASNEPTPYCVCRQNITDVFANQLKISNKLYVGCSMSLQTCPPDIDYRIMVACNDIDKCINICAYMDDKLSDIITLIPTKDMNDINRSLNALFIDHIDYEVKTNPTLSMMRNRLIQLDSYDGYCKTLKTLLEQNNFMYDFYQAFNIIPIDLEVHYNEEGVLNDDITEIISDLYEVNIVSTLCMKYWYDIDLEDINNDYVLIMDKNNNLYVVAYVSIGPKHIDIEKVESEENIEKLSISTLKNNKSIQEAATHIRINKNKYN